MTLEPRPGTAVVVIALGLHRGRLQDAYNALRGRNPRTREIEPEQRERELERLKEGQIHVLRPLNWDEFLKVWNEPDSVRARYDYVAETVLYAYALWLIGRVEFDVPLDKLSRGNGALVLHVSDHGPVYQQPGNPHPRRHLAALGSRLIRQRSSAR